MAKMSVLDIAQDILSDMNSDAVSSITDTLESLQVAQIIQSVYFEMMARKNWPHLEKLIALTPVGVSTPTHMAVPTNVKEMLSVRYDKRDAPTDAPKYREVEYVYPEDFLEYTNNRKATDAKYTEVVDPSGVSLIIQNNKQPEYYTSFDDESIVFDSYVSTLESNLQASKVQARGVISPAFSLTDLHVPDMPVEMFPTFLAECKSVCFARIKQMPDQKSEQQSRRGMSWMSKKAYQIKGGMKMPNYGKRGRRDGR